MIYLTEQATEQEATETEQELLIFTESGLAAAEPATAGSQQWAAMHRATRGLFPAQGCPSCPTPASPGWLLPPVY